MPAHPTADDLRAAFDLVEAELRRLNVQRVSFEGGLVTLTTWQTEAGHRHGEAATLRESFTDLEAATQRRPGA